MSKSVDDIIHRRAQNMLDERGAIWYFALESARRRGMSEEKKPEEGKSSIGLDSNIAGLLSYVLGWITGLIFFLLEEKDEYVRYHAMQSIIVFGAVTVVEVVLGFFRLIPYIEVLFTALQALVGVSAFVLWIVLMVKAYLGEILGEKVSIISLWGILCRLLK
jgi:uncharacterized membrane protein